MITTNFNKTVFDQNSFEKFLRWLNRDRETAGHKYEEIRYMLTKKFQTYGCQFADELTDETIDRVIKKIDFLFDNYEGNQILYFYGVAKRVFLEYTRKPSEQELPINLTQKQSNTDELEHLDHCLSKCLKLLTAEQRNFILDYYSGTKQKKILNRKKMSKDLDITSENLRVRAFRIKNKLQKSMWSTRSMI